MKYTFAIALISALSFSPAWSEVLSDCGQYSANGVIRSKKEGIQFIVNEKTQSEHIISMPIPEQAKAAGFINRDVTINLMLTKKTIGQKLESSEIVSITNRIPDPLNPQDTGFKLVKKSDCL